MIIKFEKGLLQPIMNMIRRVKRLILVGSVFCISLLTFSSCEEDLDIFDKVDDIQQQTDDNEIEKETPAIDNPDGNWFYC